MANMTLTFPLIVMLCGKQSSTIPPEAKLALYVSAVVLLELHFDSLLGSTREN